MNFVELRSQLIKKSQRLLEAKHELETMDGYKVKHFKKIAKISLLNKYLSTDNSWTTKRWN